MSATVERQLPTGTVTFLFTDIEGSTRLLTALGDRYASVLQRHGEILRGAIGQHAGTDIGTEGDSFFAVFSSAANALRAAVDAQKRLAAEAWPMEMPVLVRMGLHTGDGRLGGDNYVGLDVHRAARIAAAGFGGQVLVSGTTQALVERELPEGVRLRDLGEHRLKDLAGAERIWQLDIPGLPSEFPALRTAGGRIGNLPPQVTPFIGRQHELEEIARLAAEHRLLTLTGPGGTGKTRLALAAAERLQGEGTGADGVAFVPLEAAVDRPQVVAGIAAVLGVRERPDRDLDESVTSYLGERDLLLVLDNFEQALSAAPFVGDLLGAAPRLRVLVTSRAALRVAGEQEYHVPPLARPDPRHLPDQEALAGYEAIALFIARARAVRPDFAVTEQNAAAVAQICSRLDGLPLAIELAAAGVKLLTPQAILERLERHLPLPGGGPTDVPARQRSLRGAIDWSYDLLGAAERRLFERLAVFAGGWTLDAAESVCNPGGELETDTLDGLAALAEASLVQPAEEQDNDPEPRFTMLQVIREYAAEKLAAGPDGELVAGRQAANVLDLVERAQPELIRADLRRWQRRLRREQENLRVALRWAIDRREATTGQRIAGALWRYWHYWGELREARQWLESVLALPGGEPGAEPGAEPGWEPGGEPGAEPAGRAIAMIGLAGVIYWQGEVDGAAQLYEEVLPVLRQLGDEQRLAETLFATSFTAFARGDTALAIARSDEAIRHFRAAGDEASARLVEIQREIGQLFAAPEAVAEGEIGRLFVIGDEKVEEGIALTREAIEITGREGRTHEQADWLGTLAQLHQNRGDYARALEAFRDTTRVWYAMGNLGMAPYLKVAAAIEVGLGRPERAVRLAAVAQRAIDELGGELHPVLMAAGDPLGDARVMLADEAYVRALEAGRAMSFDDAVAFLLDEEADAPSASAS